MKMKQTWDSILIRIIFTATVGLYLIYFFSRLIYWHTPIVLFYALPVLSFTALYFFIHFSVLTMDFRIRMKTSPGYLPSISYRWNFITHGVLSFFVGFFCLNPKRILVSYGAINSFYESFCNWWLKISPFTTLSKKHFPPVNFNENQLLTMIVLSFFFFGPIAFLYYTRGFEHEDSERIKEAIRAQHFHSYHNLEDSLVNSWTYAQKREAELRKELKGIREDIQRLGQNRGSRDWPDLEPSIVDVNAKII